MALPLILQKSGRFVPPYIIGISSIRLNWVASIPYIPHFLKHQQCWFSMIQYLEDKANSVDSQHLPKSDDVTSPPGFWIHHVEDMPKARSGHTRELGDEGAAISGDRRLTPYPGPNDPMIVVGILEDLLSEILHEIHQWNESISEKKYSSWIHEWEVRMGRLRSLTINFWLSHGHPSGFGSRKLIFPHQKRGRKEPSDFESRQNFIIQKFPPNDQTVMILMMTLDVSADWEGWGSLSRGHHSFQQTFPYWEGGNTMRSRKTHSMHFSNKNPGHTWMPQAGSPSTNGVAAPAAAKAPQNRTKPLHFCMASMLVLLDLRALFILITIHPWCFPSFLRSGKTPTKNCLELGYSNKGFQGTFVDSFGETLGDWPPEFWAIFVFQLGIPFRIKPSTFAPLHHHCVTTEPST